MPSVMLTTWIYIYAMMILVISLILWKLPHSRVIWRTDNTLDLFVMVHFGVRERMWGIGGCMLHHLGVSRMVFAYNWSASTTRGH